MVLVTINYKGTGLGALPGTENDAREMMITFTKFGYEVVQLRNENATKHEIIFVLKQISQYLRQYNEVTEGKVIIFAFSGHGTSGDRVITHDNLHLSLKDDILPPFVENPNVYTIPKLFFIDACRGSSYLRSKNAEEDSIKTSVEKYEILKGLKHHKGNFFIDYATIPQHVAYDSEWMHLLAKEIRDSNESLQNIAANVRARVRENQQCETVDRLRGGAFYFNKQPM